MEFISILCELRRVTNCELFDVYSVFTYVTLCCIVTNETSQSENYEASELVLINKLRMFLLKRTLLPSSRKRNKDHIGFKIHLLMLVIV